MLTVASFELGNELVGQISRDYVNTPNRPREFFKTPGQGKQDVFDGGIVSDPLIDGDRPRRCRPDDGRDVGAPLGCLCNSWAVRSLKDLELHVDLGRGDVLIFDLGLGQRGLLDRRPHHRLGAAIDLAALGELHQLGDDRRLRLEIHRQVRIVPVAADAEPLQLLALGVDPMLGVSAALGPEFLDRHLVLVELLLAILLLDLPFDREAVAVPAGHIGRVLAQQSLGADDHVLQDVVQRMADVHVAIGVGRAVVKDELLAPFAARPNLLVQVAFQPAGENCRLLLRQAGFHRKVGLRQEDGRAIIPLQFGGVRAVGHCARL